MSRELWPVAAGAVLAATALLALHSGQGSLSAESPPPLPSAPTWEVAPAQRDAAARPLRVRIPAIDVDSALIDIAVDTAGELIPPESAAVAGWFAAGPAPGALGPALLAGHVDSRLGPGVFFRLADLAAGDVVEVERADGTTARFAVASVARTPKTAFPTDLVYAPTPGPELRLVTCGGTFDRSARSYRDNVIVEAVLIT
jgi:sortase (surface protein transpeptidase)